MPDCDTRSLAQRLEAPHRESNLSCRAESMALVGESRIEKEKETMSNNLMKSNDGDYYLVFEVDAVLAEKDKLIEQLTTKLSVCREANDYVQHQLFDMSALSDKRRIEARRETLEDAARIARDYPSVFSYGAGLETDIARSEGIAEAILRLLTVSETP